MDLAAHHCKNSAMQGQQMIASYWAATQTIISGKFYLSPHGCNIETIGGNAQSSFSIPMGWA
jgi:hypothetical protein